MTGKIKPGTISNVPDLTANEVAALAGVPARAVWQAVEDGVVTAEETGRRRAFASDAVGYLVLLREIDWPVPVEAKRRLAGWLRTPRRGPLALKGPILLDTARLAPILRAAKARAERYRRARARWIVRDPAVLGGTPVIRGTRLAADAVLARIDAGEAMAEIAADNPDLPLEALETALLFARANPPRGRPGGRPWRRPG